jgi:hypothetical protein
VLPGGAALLSTITKADGFLLLGAGLSEVPADCAIDVYLYDP